MFIEAVSRCGRLALSLSMLCLGGLSGVSGAGCGDVVSHEMPDGGGSSPMPDAPDASGPLPDAGMCASTVDLTSDPANCGVCGHSCNGGTCQASQCQPVVIALAQNTPQ